jgi:hypothetical protein
MAGDQPWVIGDDVIISVLQNVWDHVYGNKIPFTIEKNTVPFDLVSLFIIIVLLLTFLSRPYRSSMIIEANSEKKLFILSLYTFGATARIKVIVRWMLVSLRSLRLTC